ncbi:MAG: DUF5683 domain-containing protein [Bacteroidia bacterium]
MQKYLGLVGLLLAQNPTVAWKLSAICPGAGQIYNRSYWKLPIVYASLTTSGIIAYSNHKQYLLYRDAYRKKIQGDPTILPDLLPENVRQLREYYRSTRDVWAIITAVLYVAQVVDAYVDAHLKHFHFYTTENQIGVAFAW